MGLGLWPSGWWWGRGVVGWGGGGRERSRYRAMPTLATMKPSRRWGTQRLATRRFHALVCAGANLPLPRFNGSKSGRNLHHSFKSLLE
jgi:hypothetical protein